MPGSNKIQNPKTEVPQTPEMNDRDFLNDMLTTEKYMTDSYSTAMNEASHQDLYNDISLIFNETQNVQRDLFNLMFEKGWYSFEAANQQAVDQSFQQFTGYNSQLPTGGMTQ